MNQKFLCSCLLAGILSLSVTGQTGNGFDLSHNVIASGGGSSVGTLGGQNYSVEGTVGQGIAGTESTGLIGSTQFRVRGGFWAFQAAAPTAATVSISGRVFTAEGDPIFKAYVSLTDIDGSLRTAMTNPLGYYRLDNIEVGQTYVIEVRNKRFLFVARVVSVDDELSDFDFTALP